MKKLLLTILAGLPILAFAQNAYVIKGKVGNVSTPSKVFLTYRSDSKYLTDSALIKNGAFTFSGNIKDTASATMFIDYKGVGINNMDRKAKKDDLHLYLVQGTTTVTSADSLSKSKIAGTKINEDNVLYRVYTKPADDKMDKLMAEYYATPAETRKTKEYDDAFEKKYDAIEKEQGALNKAYIKSHPDSYISLVALSTIGNGYAEYNEIGPLYNSLSANIKNTGNGRKYANRIEKLRTVVIGAIAPEFAEADTSGKMVNLSAFRGKYLLVDFWASWCGPCRAENPNVVKAFNKYKDRNFTILGVSLDRPNDKNKWLAAIHKDGLTWNHVSDLQFWNNAAAQQYGVQAIPQNFLLDPSGKIIGKNLRGNDLDKKLEDIFGKI